MYHLTWFSDPGHAWLQVGWDLINDLKWTNVSKYSYYDDEFVYLEEDSDAPKFLEFLNSRNLGFELVNELWYEEDSFVRDLARWV